MVEIPIILLCEISGSPCGTDTEVVGNDCQCPNCRADRERNISWLNIYNQLNNVINYIANDNHIVTDKIRDILDLIWYKYLTADDREQINGYR